MMLYLSSTSAADATVILSRFIVDLLWSSHHLVLGFGKNCLPGNRLTETQFRLLCDAALKQFPFIQMVGRPDRMTSAEISGFGEHLGRLLTLRRLQGRCA